MIQARAQRDAGALARFGGKVAKSTASVNEKGTGRRGEKENGVARREEGPMRTKATKARARGLLSPGGTAKPMEKGLSSDEEIDFW